MDGKKDASMDRWMDRLMDGWMEEYIEARTDRHGGRGGQMNRRKFLSLTTSQLYTRYTSSNAFVNITDILEMA
jgi:hypothetical protein